MKERNVPKTKRWKSIVEEISAFSEGNNNVAEISRLTTSNVRSRFKNIESDQGVQSAFEFLVLLSILPKNKNWKKYLLTKGVILPYILVWWSLLRALRNS